MDKTKIPSSLKSEREKTNRSLLAERDQTDQSLKEQNETVAVPEEGILRKTRSQTDLFFEKERSQADFEVQKVSDLLSSEVATHSKTKAALTTRDEFLAIVSHDLRNPIGAIYSCSSLLLEEPEFKNMSADMRQWIELIQRNATASLSLINDLMDMERIAEGKLALQLEKHPISPVLRESIENVRYLAAAKNILLRSLAKEDVGEAIFDRSRILQVLGNLLGNAIKFSPTGGSIFLDAHIEKDRVLFSLSDSGPGIPPEKKDKIFERFAQIGVKDRRGLGLGLYISKMLVEAHRGTIGVDSDLGKGSTFWFSVPVKGGS